MSKRVPTLQTAKAAAKRLRGDLETDGTPISHARSLELVAHQYGFRDWNAFHAASLDLAPDGFTPGGRVRGNYLSQPFDAKVTSVERLPRGWFRLVLKLDTPVDVVTFESFSNLRTRVTGTIGPAGVSRERTSDGRPHIEIEI